MRDKLPKRPLTNETAIVNLDNETGPGTHWVCYIKRGNNVQYFDSFGNLRPPKELLDYFGKEARVFYNYNTYQSFDSVVCGHLCILFLADEPINAEDSKR